MRGLVGDPVRVAYILPDIDSGGTENHVLALAGKIDRSRFAPIVYATAGGGVLEAEFARVGVPVRILHLRLSPGRVGLTRSLRNAAALLFRLPAMLRKDRVSIIHAYLPAPNVIGSVVGLLARVPVRVVSKRGLCAYKAGRPLLSSLENLANRLASCVLVNSDAVRRDVERTETGWSGKIRRIYNGVEPIEPWNRAEREAFRSREGIPAGSPLVVTVSNFFPYKGHDTLVRAAGLLQPAFPEVRLALVGRDAGTLAAVRRQGAEAGLSETLLFPGARSDVADFLRAADLFVHPSREEGFSNAILEAMAAGLPVVAFDVGGNSEAVVDGETGLLVPPDDHGKLADAIASLLRDPDRARAMGEAGRRRAIERFPVTGMIREIEAMYESLISGRSGKCAE